MSPWTARVLALAALGVTFLVFLGSGAGAFWGGSGTGSGSAASSGTVPVVLTPGTPTTALRPGATADVVVIVSNPNPASLRIGSLSLDPDQGTGGYAVDDAHSDCALSSVSFSTQSNAGAGWTVPGRVGTVDGTATLTLPGAVALDVDAANACQGATFSLFLSAGS